MPVLVDHVEELQPLAIGCGVVLEVHRPHLMGMFDSTTPDKTDGALGV
jgi:hypothetical protein